jgi:hypothetical protein
MLHTIKNPKEDFNLLFLSENEFIINSLYCNFYHSKFNFFEKGIFHLTTKGLIFQPNEFCLPVYLFKFKDNLQIKFYTLDDIYSVIQKDNSIIKDSVKQNTYVGKNVLMRQLTKKSLNNNLSESPKLKNSSYKRNSYTANYTSKRASEGMKEESNINQNINWNNFKMGDFSECLNLIVCGNNNKRKENILNNQINIIDNKNIKNNSSNINQINTNIKIFSMDINHFFNDNSLNLKSFYELIKFLKEEVKDSNKYNFLLFTINKYECVSRVQIGIYEKEKNPSTFFFIIEGIKKEIQNFNDNRKIINEILHYRNSFDDIREINHFIKKKVNEIYENPKNEIYINNNQIQFKLKTMRLLPEGNQYGILICSKNPKYDSHYIRFYPIINNYKRNNLTIQLNKIEAIIKYRYLYKNKGLNILLYYSKRSKIFIFENETDCEKIEDYLQKNSPNIDKLYTNIEHHTDLWTRGLILNYDYLLYLNFMAGRSFNDLSQYPVFPWILSNYEGDENFDLNNEKNYRDLSKPIGALNPDKLSKFNEKYLKAKANINQQENIFLYPIHYSSPLIIMFYLNRQFPRFQLQMQVGTFENGIMDGIKEFWEYLYSEGNDVMELIPEFFEGDGEFLLNYNNLLYGQKKKNSNENMKLIPDVILPKWSKTPMEFISINRCALEGDYVSNNLNNWIDLIFGYKQKGEMAEMHENLFRINTYDDYNLDNVSENKKYNEINNILLCGQTPKQIFIYAHPKKKNMDLLCYELQSNPNDALLKFKKENEKLEKNYKKMVKKKYEENENMINEFKEIEKRKIEEIENIKNTFDNTEKKQNEIIEKLIGKNEKLKKDFDIYDKNKDIFVNDYINRLEKENNEEMKKKFSSPQKIIEYIREMEKEINKYKIREIDYKEEIEKKTKEIEKYTLIQNDLKKQIEKLDNKISLSEKLIKNEKNK